MGQRERRDRRPSTRSDDNVSDKVALLEPFSHQVGGHACFLSLEERTLCKPFTYRESKFYQSLPAELTSFVPEFRGVIELCSDNESPDCFTLSIHPLKGYRYIESPRSDNEFGQLRWPTKIQLKQFAAETSQDHFDNIDASLDDNHSVVNHTAWALQRQASKLAKFSKSRDKLRFLLLENLAYRYHFPCVLDLKMGTKLYGDDATSEKRLSQMAKSNESTSAMLGVRMCGMQVYDEVSGKYNCYGKYLGRRLTVDGFKQVIKSYFHNGVQFHSVLIDSLIPKLQTLSKILFCCNGFRFFSSSLLVIYDGDRYNNEVADIDIRMIDFEHSTFPGFKDDPSYDGPDTGYLKGIESLISVMRQIQRDAYDAK